MATPRKSPNMRTPDVRIEEEKAAAAEAAVELVTEGMSLGLGTGSTAAYFLAALARRSVSVRCVASSPRTERAAREHGLAVEPFDTINELDITIDGADQIAPDGWLVKGGGAAHTREKILAAAARQFIVIADSTKTVDSVHAPIPVELLGFGLEATLRRLMPVLVREVPASPDGGVIADYQGSVGEPDQLAAWLSATPGLVEHGLFPPQLVSTVLIGRGQSVEQRTPAQAP